MSDFQILHGDCLDHLRTFADKSVDVVITDPPYGVRKAEEWDDRDNFLNQINSWLDEVHRVARAGVLWFCAGQMLPHILRNRADTFHRLLVWNKPPGSQFAGASYNRLWYSIEPILVFDCGGLRDKGKAAAFGYQCFNARPIPSKLYGHPTTKPVELASWLVSHFSDVGDTILDPFCGSGSIGVACTKLGRDYIGIDMEQKYVDITKRRILQTEKAMACEIAFDG